MHPACPNKKQNHLQNSFLRRAQFWVRKTFSKPASLKRASLVALPAAISHKASLKPKRCASATLIQKTSKNEPKHGPKNGTAWRSHFWDRMHSLVKEQKKSTFTVPFLGPSGGTKNETAKSQNQQQRPTRATNKKWQLRLVKQQAYRVGTEEARTCEAWFQLTFRPQKWNLKAHMWYQLSPFPSSNAAIAMQHHPGNIHQSVATPRYSATPWYVLIQLPNVIDTISKRWRSKKAFNTSPCRLLWPTRRGRADSRWPPYVWIQMDACQEAPCRQRQHAGRGT